MRTRRGLRCVFVVGTRPDAIKLAPVVMTCRDRGIEAPLLSTGQHPHLTVAALDEFGLAPDEDLRLHRPGLSLSDLVGVMVPRIDRALAGESAGLVCVQGDTATALGGALAAYHRKIPVVHVEAGLRSGRSDVPFPEEMYRRLIAQMSSLHCAPTTAARQALLREGIPDEDVIVSGNSVIDAMRLMGAAHPEKTASLDRRRLVLVTCHRRENWGSNYSSICAAVAALARRADIRVVMILHPNAGAHTGAPTRAAVSSSEIELIGPQSYRSFLSLLRQAFLVMTDSGGVQEEAAALGRPVLVLRERTERMEGVAFGTARVIGTRTDAILRESMQLLEDEAHYERMSRPCRLYGDGFAAERIVDAMIERFAHRSDDRPGRAAGGEAAAPVREQDIECLPGE